MKRLSAALALLSLTAIPASLQAQATHATKRPPAGDATSGGEVFQRQCVMCHSSEPGTKIVGPSLYHVMKGPHALTARAIQQITANGKGTMPSFRDKLTDQQVADLIAHLRTL